MASMVDRWMRSLVCALTVACAVPQASESLAEPLEKVKITDGPYLDFVVFRVAKSLGWDHELGLDFELTSSTKIPGEQLASGATDIGDSSVTGGFAFYKQVPTYRDFMIDDVFRGFTIVGHPGKQKTFQAYLDATGGDAAAAKRQFISTEIKGKSFCLYAAAYSSIISGMLAQADLALSDVTIVNFADEALGANAFLRDQCAYYTGSLPQELRLLSEYKEDAVAVAPQLVFGTAPNGILFYTTYATTSDWLAKHPETAQKLWAVQLRFAQIVKARPPALVDRAVAAAKDLTGSALNHEAISLALSSYLSFPTYDEIRSSIFKSGDPLNFYDNAERLLADAKKIGGAPADAEVRTFQVERQVFEKLGANEELMRWINKPL
jgi:ABC-type nitrate/sulfonate/bicarbonate transport system substrate-binding protein